MMTSAIDERAFWLAIRQALLMIVDAIEVRLEMPRTSEMRERLRQLQILQPLAG